MLTVIGFSVHDTIVVFDRIRENKARHAGEPFARDRQPLDPADVRPLDQHQPDRRPDPARAAPVRRRGDPLLRPRAAHRDHLRDLLVDLQRQPAPRRLAELGRPTARSPAGRARPAPPRRVLSVARRPTAMAARHRRRPAGRPVQSVVESADEGRPAQPEPCSNPASAGSFPTPIELDPALVAAAARLGVSGRTGRDPRRPRHRHDRAALRGLLRGLRRPACTTRRLLPDAERLRERLDPARARSGERVLVFGDFDADGLTGLAIMVRALRRFGLGVEPYVPSRLEEGHGLSLRGGRQPRPSRSCGVIVTVDCGSTSVARDRRGAAGAGSTSSSPTTTASRRSCPPRLRRRQPAPARQPTTPTIAWPAAASRSSVAQLLLADEPGGPESALDLAELADDRDGRRRRPDPRREPGDRPARPGAHADGAPSRDRRPPRSRRHRPRGRRPRDGGSFVDRPAAQRGRPGRRAPPTRPRLLLTDDRGRGRRPRRAARGRPTSTAATLTPPGGRRSATPRSRAARRRRRDRRPRAVAGRGHRPRRGPPGRGARAAGGRRGGARRRRSGPRAGAPAASTWRPILEPAATTS